MNLYHTMGSGIEEVGFINIHEKNYKAPVSAWPEHAVYRDAGRLGPEYLKAGIEGRTIFLLSKVKLLV